MTLDVFLPLTYTPKRTAKEQLKDHLKAQLEAQLRRPHKAAKVADYFCLRFKNSPVTSKDGRLWQ